MRYGLWTVLLTWGLVGCAEEKPFDPTNSIDVHSRIEPTLQFSRSLTEMAPARIALNADTKVTLFNVDFQSPRRIEHETRLPQGESSAPVWELEPTAQREAEKLFPETQLKLLHSRKGDRFTYVTFQQMKNEREVLNARLVMRMNNAGEWVTASSTLVHPSLLAAMDGVDSQVVTPSVFLQEPYQVIRERRVIYPRKDDSQIMRLHSAREFAVFLERSQMEFYLWIDETTGLPLGALNPAAGLSERITIKGSVVPNQPGESPLEFPFPRLSAILDNQQKLTASDEGSFDRTALSGRIAKLSLRNATIAVVDNNKEDSEFTLVPDRTGDSVVIDTALSLEERNVYYWLMKARDHLRDRLKYAGMTYQMLVITNYGEKFDNAFFMPLTKSLSFGAGGSFLKNTAHSRDIILHEYGHGVTHDIYGLNAGYEFSAMNEAFSDYFAATITSDPDIAEGALTERAGKKVLRTIQNDFVYPKSFTGEGFHNDGQMFGGALWDLRKAVGAEVADKLIHEARLAQAKTISEFLMELLAIDEDADDHKFETPSKNFQAIWDAFARHGLHYGVSFNQAPPENLTTPWKPPSIGCFSVVH